MIAEIKGVHMNDSSLTSVTFHISHFRIPRLTIHQAVAALADCVEAFKGAVIIVSHDQYFVGRVAKEVWVVDKGKINREESFSTYIKKKAAAVKMAWERKGKRKNNMQHRSNLAYCRRTVR